MVWVVLARPCPVVTHKKELLVLAMVVGRLKSNMADLDDTTLTIFIYAVAFNTVACYRATVVCREVPLTFD